MQYYYSSFFSFEKKGGQGIHARDNLAGGEGSEGNWPPLTFLSVDKIVKTTGSAHNHIQQ